MKTLKYTLANNIFMNMYIYMMWIKKQLITTTKIIIKFLKIDLKIIVKRFYVNLIS